MVIEPSELFEGLVGACLTLSMCKLEHRNGAAAFSEFTPTADVTDGISVAGSGRVTIDYQTFIVPENEEFRLSCDSGANVSPPFTAVKLTLYASGKYCDSRDLGHAAT